MQTGISQRKKLGWVLFALFATILTVTPAILTSQFGLGISPILTGSMAPDAQPGDVYITHIVLASSLKKGDIIAINNQVTGTYYSHRIFEIRPMNGVLRIITKGDANPDVDRDPYMASVNGEVSLVGMRLPWVGRPMVYMNTIQGRQTAATFLVFANILGLFAFLFRKKIVHNTTKERVYRELYTEERANIAHYRDVVNQLQESLAIEREKNEMAGENK